MELLPILRLIRRRWIGVALGVAAAIAVTVLGLRGAPAGAGLARASVVLDSRPSQLIKPDPLGAETLGWRSSALANQAAAPVTMRAVAGRLGVPTGDVLITNTVLAEPESSTALARRASKAAAVAWEPYVILVTAREDLGMVYITAHAQTGAMAGRAAKALQDTLVAATPPVAAATPTSAPAPGATPDPASPLAAPTVRERFVIEAASPVRSRTVVDSGGAAVAPVAGLVVFFVWLGAIAVLDTLLRLWSSRTRVPAPASAA